MDLSDSLFTFKIILLGDNNVGKTSIFLRYTQGSFPYRTHATIGVDFRIHYQEVEPGVTVQLLLFDTAGQEKFWPVTRNYLPGARGILLVFDLCDRTSFEHAEYLHGEIRENSMKHLDTVLFVLVGHKCDQNEPKVNREEAERLASKLRAPYFEVSSKTGHNVAEIFDLLTRRIYQGMLRGYESSEKWDEDTSTTTSVTTQNDKNKTCIVT